MKKLLAFLLAVIMLISLAACNRSEPKDTENNNKPSESENQDNTVGQDNTTESTVTNWGVQDKVSASNSQETVSFLISFPDHVGTLQGTGKIAKQADGTLIIVDGQNKTTSQEVATLSEVFPAYFAQAESVLKGYYRMRGADFKFEIKEQSEVKINGYDMIKFSGSHSYSYEQEPVNCNWVAYATQLKSNGAYVYWLVLDAAENKTTNSDIADIAQKMAASLKEE